MFTASCLPRSMCRLFKYGFMAMLIMVASILNQCFAQDNPLIGSWKWDNIKTLQELEVPQKASPETKRSATKAKRIVEMMGNKLGSNVTFTYTEKSCLEIVFDNKGNELSRESFPYKIVKKGKDFASIDQLDNGGVINIFFKENYFYVEMKVDDFVYKDYFVRL